MNANDYSHASDKLQRAVFARRRRTIAQIALIAVFGSLSTAAFASPVVYQQLPDTSTAALAVNDTPNRILADDFPLTQSTQITDLHVFGAFLGDNLPSLGASDVTFSLSLHTDNGLSPSLPINPPLWQVTTTANATSLYASSIAQAFFDPVAGFMGSDSMIYEYDFNISPITLGPGVYWLNVEAQPGATANGVNSIFGWSSTAATGNLGDAAAWGNAALGNYPAFWNSSAANAASPPFDLAFGITGVPVPEPSTLFMGGMGLLGFLILACRRRQARWLRLCAMLAVSLSATAPSCLANVIDFETTPGGGPPVDNQVLNAPYNITGGGTVSFYFDDNLNNTYDPGTDSLGVFEAAGQDGTDGFASAYWGINDTAYPGYAADLGNFFLRQPVPGTVPAPFIVDYNTSQTITALSGEIWDIDGGGALGTEQWLVDVLDSANNILATELSPLGNSSALDSKPWTFSFTGLPLGVEKVRLTFVGTKTQGLGLAFNNFSPTTVYVPEPTSLCMAGFGLATLLTVACRSRRARKPGIAETGA